jgi:signal peptidase II
MNNDIPQGTPPLNAPDPLGNPSGPPSEPTGTAAGQPRARRRRLLLILAGLAVFAYALDQLTKWLVSSTMREGQVIPVLPPLLNWHFIRNSGAAFSIGENFTWFFTLVMTGVAVAILVQARKVGSVWWSIALGMLLGGALGNLTDRLFRAPSFGMGHVVDFIALPNFAIFNVADSAVVGSVILICILTFKGIPFRGAPPAAKADR